MQNMVSSTRKAVCRNAAGVVTMVRFDHAIDFALQAIIGDPCYSGEVETRWTNGGFRAPGDDRDRFKEKDSVRLMLGASYDEAFVKPLRELLPEKFTGVAAFRLSNGEFSGKPLLRPFSRKK
ncbi:hypothetical protein [Trichlorobacter lovleyi]|uniref:Uncharacterized protein n=1 Tax=Trichlorobacter lovleyi (strain ATCC BAA-1151 / DSM 17278 / SZ) TaxID=398767 RepID=B3E9V1_TRIL1|nr:hypothetical protein [Trichlorobacter lovleyi]ACD96826.1 hypothetical protein Glov_3120 [Trichlorobacter lovleyi SZ]